MKFRWLLLPLVLGLFPVAADADGLVYRGDQTLIKNTVWQGDVLIDGILTVAAGVTLDIRPGTTVRFTRYDTNADGIGEHEIFSQGTIRAVGTAEAPILFSSAEEEPRQGDWGAINMMVSEEDNHLQYCVVEYGYRGFHAHFSRARLLDSLFRKNLRGVQFQESQVVIQNCRFVDNTNGLQFRDSQVVLTGNRILRNQWGLRCVYSDVTIRNCEIVDNLINGVNIRDGKLQATGNRLAGNRRGLYLQRSEGTIAGNVLVGNSEHGIFLEDSKVEIVDNHVVGNGRAGVRWVNSTGRIARNRLEANGEYALINDGASRIDARNNWWGTANPAQITHAVRDGLDRPGMGMTDHRYPLLRPLPMIANQE